MRPAEGLRALQAIEAVYSDLRKDHILSEHGEALVLRTPTRAYVVFKGTGGRGFWGNVLDDISAWPARPPYGAPGRIHAGFLRHYRELMASGLALEYAKLATENRKIMVTGFSLGGALAVLAGEELRNQWGIDPQVITFAAPPVGTKAYAGSTGPLTRVVLKGDAVPLLPPWYRHAEHADLVLLDGGRPDLRPEHDRQRYYEALLGLKGRG